VQWAFSQGKCPQTFAAALYTNPKNALALLIWHLRPDLSLCAGRVVTSVRIISKTAKLSQTPWVHGVIAKSREVVSGADVFKLMRPATAFSIHLFTETRMPSGFFLKKKPPCRCCNVDE
jgi:hypothetical protein